MAVRWVILWLYIQGSYLGDLLSRTNGEITKQSTSELEKEGVKTFNYRHLGSFAYIGDNKAVLQLPIIGMLIAMNYCDSLMVIECRSGYQNKHAHIAISL